MKLLATFPCCLIFLLAASLGAQDADAKKSSAKEPDELTQMRKSFATRALQSSSTLAEQYSAALATVMKETGATGDYEQALAAQKKREELVSLYSKTLNETKLSNVIILKPSEARISGSVNYDRTSGALVNWKNVGASASWDISKIVPGSYDIGVTYSVAEFGEAPARNTPFISRDDPSTGGQFEFYEDTSLTGSVANRRTGQVRSTDGWDNFVTMNLPPIQLSRSSARFAMKITHVRGEGGVMHLKEIRLTPAKAATSEQGASSDPVRGDEAPKDDLTKLRDIYLTRVKSVVPPVLTAYTNKLKSLGSIAEAKKDTELAESVSTEVTRTQHLLEAPETADVIFAGASSNIQSLGFEEWKNVHYKSSPRNGGDRFLVEYKGQDIPVRLLSVTTPYASEDASVNMKHHASYFGISEEDTNTLASRAKEFTEAFLQNKPFRIFTRGMKDSDGLLFVNIVPDGVGDYAGVLVDNGLAAINSPKTKSNENKSNDEPNIMALKERETEAKARPIPPGAWAMVPETPPEKK